MKLLSEYRENREKFSLLLREEILEKVDKDSILIPPGCIKLPDYYQGWEKELKG